MAAFPQQHQQQVHFESFLEKKEKKWISYWVVLKGPHVWFFKDRTSDMKKFVGRLDIGPSSTVQATKSKKNNYQFTLSTVRGLYRLKVSRLAANVNNVVFIHPVMSGHHSIEERSVVDISFVRSTVQVNAFSRLSTVSFVCSLHAKTANHIYS
eukprot:m.47590 g.47590  ORF g.47590 m.47590 type:complete len:153 (+) comp33806_c0_seq1:49-507(+)